MSKERITIFFFKNGQPLQAPHKVEVERQKLEKYQIVKRINRLLYYNGYVVYTLFGEVLRSIKEIHNESAFVAVPRDRCFLPGPYTKAFRDYINEKLPILKEKRDKVAKKDKSLQKNARQCTKRAGCRHPTVEAGRKTAGIKNTGESCDCQNFDARTLNSRKSKTRIKRKKKSSIGWRTCFKRKERRKEPIVRLRKCDLTRIEQERTRREPKTKRGSTCFGRKLTRAEHYKKQREKLVKQRNDRIVNDEKHKAKVRKALQSRTRSRRRKQRFKTLCCPCCTIKPVPMIVPPPPHSCTKHLRHARHEACRRRRELAIQEQPSWESIAVPPMSRKRIRGTQTTKDDLKRAHKASGTGGWNCFGSSRRKKTVSDLEDKTEESLRTENEASLSTSISEHLHKTETNMDPEMSSLDKVASRTSVPLSLTKLPSCALSPIVEDVVIPQKVKPTLVGAIDIKPEFYVPCSGQTTTVTTTETTATTAKTTEATMPTPTTTTDIQCLPGRDVVPTQERRFSMKSFDLPPSVTLCSTEGLTMESLEQQPSITLCSIDKENLSKCDCPKE
ncbi:uncharacterized protein LOC131430437 [Malaya genurostris]|uniref:uncharacterized protein LOC131430437 n=1 Tax=Malaya genurostris TaxID=325434 RepID=UPI0026F3CE8B|nr:uncharacterized protein LOC131430437 [Malaya genurostris]